MRDIIKTDRLILRQLEMKDAAAISKYGSDIDIARMTGSVPHPFPLLSAEFKVMSLQAQKRRGLAYPYAVTEDGGDLIGIMDVFRRGPDVDHELGYWIARPYWGKGYAGEAARALMDELTRRRGITKFVAGVFVDNAGSARVLEKMGFTRKGISRGHFSMARLAKVDVTEFELEGPVATAAPLPAAAAEVISTA